MRVTLTMRFFSILSMLVVIIFGTACMEPGAIHKSTDSAPLGNTVYPVAEPPERDFTKKILYDLLVAELAHQGNQLPLAVSKYLNVATTSRDVGVAEQATRVALLAQDQKRSLRAAALWMEIDPDAIDAQQIYATLLIHDKRIGKAVPILRTLAKNPDVPPDRRFILVGDLLNQGEDKEAALVAMERVIAEHDDDPNALFALAHFLTQIDKKERAIDLLERVLTMDGKNPVIWLYYSQFLRSQGKTAQALDTFSNALASGIEDKNIRIGFARLLISEKRYEEARKQFEKLIASDPEDAEIRYILASFLIEIGHADEARKHLLHLIDQMEFVHEAYFKLGQIAESQKDIRAAMDLYRKVEDGNHYLDAQIRIADFLAKQQKIQAARQHLHDILPGNTEDSIRLYRTEGEILIDVGDFEEAMSIYNVALSEYPKSKELLYARAMLAGRMGRLSILEQNLRRLLSHEPDNVDALNALGYTLANQTDRYREAIALIQRALALQPNSYYILDSMGWVLYRLGQHRKAISYLQRALAIQQDAEIAAHLGEVLWVTGNPIAARDVWNKALKEFPNDKLLLEVMGRFGLSDSE